MKPEHSKLLHDVKLACEAIHRFTKGRSLEDYANDDMLRSAVERQFEIALVHGYDSIRDEVAWDTAGNHVPVLLEAVNSRLQQA